jgi:hypothetical protein
MLIAVVRSLNLEFGYLVMMGDNSDVVWAKISYTHLLVLLVGVTFLVARRRIENYLVLLL